MIFTLVSTSLVIFPKCYQSHFIIFGFLSAVILGIGVTVWNFTAQANLPACVLLPLLHPDRLWKTGFTDCDGPFIVQERHPSSVALFFICHSYLSLIFLFRRRKVLLNFNVNTRHSSLTLSFSFFPLMKNRAKEAKVDSY